MGGNPHVILGENIWSSIRIEKQKILRIDAKGKAIYVRAIMSSHGLNIELDGRPFLVLISFLFLNPYAKSNIFTQDHMRITTHLYQWMSWTQTYDLTLNWRSAEAQKISFEPLADKLISKLQCWHVTLHHLTPTMYVLYHY